MISPTHSVTCIPRIMSHVPTLFSLLGVWGGIAHLLICFSSHSQRPLLLILTSSILFAVTSVNDYLRSSPPWCASRQFTSFPFMLRPPFAPSFSSLASAAIVRPLDLLPPPYCSPQSSFLLLVPNLRLPLFLPGAHGSHLILPRLFLSSFSPLPLNASGHLLSVRRTVSMSVAAPIHPMSCLGTLTSHASWSAIPRNSCTVSARAPIRSPSSMVYAFCTFCLLFNLGRPEALSAILCLRRAKCARVDLPPVFLLAGATGTLRQAPISPLSPPCLWVISVRSSSLPTGFNLHTSYFVLFLLMLVSTSFPPLSSVMPRFRPPAHAPSSLPPLSRILTPVAASPALPQRHFSPAPTTLALVLRPNQVFPPQDMLLFCSHCSHSRLLL